MTPHAVFCRHLDWLQIYSELFYSEQRWRRFIFPAWRNSLSLRREKYSAITQRKYRERKKESIFERTLSSVVGGNFCIQRKRRKTNYENEQSSIYMGEAFISNVRTLEQFSYRRLHEISPPSTHLKKFSNVLNRSSPHFDRKSIDSTGRERKIRPHVHRTYTSIMMTTMEIIPQH